MFKIQCTSTGCQALVCHSLHS